MLSFIIGGTMLILGIIARVALWVYENPKKGVPMVILGVAIFALTFMVQSLEDSINSGRFGEAFSRIFSDAPNNVKLLENETGIIMVGDTIRFGNHDWYVLELYENETALIISSSIIGQRAFHDAQMAITWEDSDIRHYLNNNFFNTFTNAEQERIQNTTVQNPGMRSNTEDQIFLLNARQVETLFVGDNYGRAGSNWWFRTPAQRNGGDDSRTGEFVRTSTARFQSHARVLTHDVGIRPALHLCLQDFRFPQRPWIYWDNERIFTGDTISFGEKSWLVLEMFDDNSILVLSENILEIRSYHNESVQIPWVDSNIRRYLNETLYNAFSQVDRQLILPTVLRNADGSGATTDKLFLLDFMAVERYFPYQSTRVANDGGRNSRNASWWLRSTDGFGDSISNTGNRNQQRGANSVTQAHGVRPALRLAVDIQNNSSIYDTAWDMSLESGMSNLLGEWHGTFYNERGVAGMHLYVFRSDEEQGGYLATVRFVPHEDAYERQISAGSFNVRPSFNYLTGRYDMAGISNRWDEPPTPGGFGTVQTWFGYLNDGVFSGGWRAWHSGTFELHRVEPGM